MDHPYRSGSFYMGRFIEHSKDILTFQKQQHSSNENNGTLIKDEEIGNQPNKQHKKDTNEELEVVEDEDIHFTIHQDLSSNNQERREEQQDNDQQLSIGGKCNKIATWNLMNKRDSLVISSFKNTAHQITSFLNLTSLSQP